MWWEGSHREGSHSLPSRPTRNLIILLASRDPDPDPSASYYTHVAEIHIPYRSQRLILCLPRGIQIPYRSQRLILCLPRGIQIPAPRGSGTRAPPTSTSDIEDPQPPVHRRRVAASSCQECQIADTRSPEKAGDHRRCEQPMNGAIRGVRPFV